MADLSPTVYPNERVDFGRVILEPEAEVFLKNLNTDFLSLLQAIPGTVRTEAALFLLKHAGSLLPQQPNLFRHYYPPSWSILYWIVRKRLRDHEIPDETLVKNARAGHIRAMYLHSLDDHLNDGDLPVSHLALLIRSQAWLEMKTAFEQMALSIDGGHETIERLIDEYYGSVCGPQHLDESLDGYCHGFIRQMSTCFIAPSLLMKTMGFEDDHIDRVIGAYGSFGVAWRLLDDVRDIEADLQQSAPSAVYICLSGKMKACWNKGVGGKTDADQKRIRTICRHIEDNRICERVLQQVCTEMESAAVQAENCGLEGLAMELRCLLKPLSESRFGSA